MARTVNQEFQALKRGEILDAAMQLVSSKGYEDMAIQDILELLGISKGAFYHYFASKGALLQALVDHLLVGVEDVLAPIAQDVGVNASEAFSRFFAALATYKAGHKPLILAVMPVWYSDDNAIVREKVRVGFAARLAPLLATIIRRGCKEGSFKVSVPEETARVVLGLTQDLADALARVVLGGDPNAAPARRMEAMVAATTEAIERLLAAPVGSIRLAETGATATWLQGDERTA